MQRNQLINRVLPLVFLAALASQASAQSSVVHSSVEDAPIVMQSAYWPSVLDTQVSLVLPTGVSDYGTGAFGEVMISGTELPAGNTPPYSYYAAPLGTLPRPYVGYGQDIFPYYGQPYGHAYDRWSWGNLSGDNGLSRYYYPPVR